MPEALKKRYGEVFGEINNGTNLLRTARDMKNLIRDMEKIGLGGASEN